MPLETREITKVLIVDDDEVVRTTLGDIFKKRGYDIKAVGTAAEALEEVKKNPYHFAVLDIHLPDKSGTDLLDEIRKINFKINCIMITGYSEETPEESLERGAKAHLTKPLKIEELVKIFQRETSHDPDARSNL
ncbi:MAG: response regulator [Deltaproteobacteria bacterium]|nr:response regulator [Deltaproteobacteria bacterium]